MLRALPLGFNMLDSFLATGFMPHGYCMMWRGDIVWLHVIADTLIAAAYCSIPVTLLHFVKRRPDFPYPWVFRLFGAFILACAATHVMGIVTLWLPIYGIEGVIKLATALLSVGTAVVLVKVAPQAVRLRSPAELEAANLRLTHEINLRREAETSLRDAHNSLELRVDERTRELASKNAELAVVNQEMEQMLRTVSHDLKSPLITVQGFLSVMLDNIAGPEPDTQGAQSTALRIQLATRRMGALLDDLAQVGRIGRAASDVEHVSVSGVVMELRDDLSPRIEEAQAELTIQQDMPEVWGNRRHIMQAFENLLTNALKYGCPAAGGKLDVGAESDQNEVRFFVRDNGPGIDERYHRSVFELFRRLNPEQGGTGVGLAVVAKIAALHQGRAWVESEPGNGATFWLAFPRSEQVQ